MNYKNIIFGLILVTLIFNSSLVFAEQEKNFRYYYENTDTLKQDLIENINSLPNIAQKAIKNDKIEIKVTTDTEPLLLFIERSKNGEYKITKEKIEKVNVYISGKEETINRILESQDPISELNSALKTKEIEIKTKGLFRSIKYKLAKLFFK